MSPPTLFDHDSDQKLCAFIARCFREGGVQEGATSFAEVDRVRNGGQDPQRAAIVLTPWSERRVLAAISKEISLLPACKALHATALIRSEEYSHGMFRQADGSVVTTERLPIQGIEDLPVSYGTVLGPGRAEAYTVLAAVRSTIAFRYPLSIAAAAEASGHPYAEELPYIITTETGPGLVKRFSDQLAGADILMTAAATATGGAHWENTRAALSLHIPISTTKSRPRSEPAKS